MEKAPILKTYDGAEKGFYVQIYKRIERPGNRFLPSRGLWFLLLVMFSILNVTTAQVAGPLVVSRNPHYFQDAKGNVLILTG